MLLTLELRQTFAALWVKGGNCFWRAVSKALLGEYWCQLKLVVLEWSSVNVESLVGKVGPLHLNNRHYEQHIHVQYMYRDADGKPNEQFDDYASMLLANIAWLCGPKRWGGDLSGILVAERLGVVMKMPIPVVCGTS